MTTPDADAVVRALLEVRGIADARIEPAPGTPGNLVLELTPDADSAAVAVAVRGLLRDRFGLGVAPEPARGGAPGPSTDEVLAAVLHLRPVAEAESKRPAEAGSPEEKPDRRPEPPPLGPGFGARPELGRLRLAPEGLGIAVAVELAWPDGGDGSVGQASAPNTGDGVRRAVAEAALRAVNERLGQQVRLDLADLAVVPVGSHRVAVVRAVWSDAGGVVTVTGASDVRDDVRQAVVRAVLAATNRRLVQL